MRFYDILQLDPQVNKSLVKQRSNRKEKFKFKIGMVLRSILIVAFAILFIASLSSIFGNENSPMAVVIFCILLGVRFVDFGYCIRDSLLNLALAFFILLFSPILAYKAFPVVAFIIYFISFSLILFITCDKPEMGNGGLFSFAYIYLSGNPVFGESLYQRLILTILGILICGTIFYAKHRDKNKNIRFLDKIKEFSMHNNKHKWMIRMSLGVSIILALGNFFQIERFIWAGFACGSLLSDYSSNPQIKVRFVQRFVGVIIGSVLFYIIFSIVPESLHMIIGPLGGFCLGLCTDYKYKTAMNCLGALMLATGTYGVHSAVLLRIADTIIGIVFALVFYYFYEYLFAKTYKLKI